jgi:hypothetical protein
MPRGEVEEGVANPGGVPGLVHAHKDMQTFRMIGNPHIRLSDYVDSRLADWRTSGNPSFGMSGRVQMSGCPVQFQYRLGEYSDCVMPGNCEEEGISKA